MTKVKICGLSTPESLTAAIEKSASHIGFVFYPKSPRYVTIEMASYLNSYSPPSVQTVGLFVDPDMHTLMTTLDSVKIDMIQLHGHESPAQVHEIKKRTAIPVMKAIAISTKDDLNQIPLYQEQCDYFLFDAKPDPALTLIPGGNGLTFDWSILKDFKCHKPWFLAGGLHPHNVAEAIQRLNPYGVDVSSGVESALGVKDPLKIASFLDAVKSA